MVEWEHAERSPAYRERLWPAPWVFIATALVIPASLLVFLPISLPRGHRRSRSCSTARSSASCC